MKGKEKTQTYLRPRQNRRPPSPHTPGQPKSCRTRSTGPWGRRMGCFLPSSGTPAMPLNTTDWQGRRRTAANMCPWMKVVLYNHTSCPQPVKRPGCLAGTVGQSPLQPGCGCLVACRPQQQTRRNLGELSWWKVGQHHAGCFLQLGHVLPVRSRRNGDGQVIPGGRYIQPENSISSSLWLQLESEPVIAEPAAFPRLPDSIHEVS